MASTTPPRPPRGYEIVGVLGRGGSGSSVYLARQTSLNRLVALKNLPIARLSEASLQMFRGEARAVGSLRNPNIVSAFDFAQDANGLWLATQLVHGPDLRALIRKVGALSPGFALSVVLQVGHALAAAHAAAIVHRDVKPANVLVSPDGMARLTDFGVAQIAGDNTTGLVVGTPTYMAPEQVRGVGYIDGRTDLYALSLVAYEVLVGHYPFHVDRRNSDAVMDAQLHTAPADPESFGANIPRRIKNAILSGLAKEVDRRPASVAIWCAEMARGSRRSGRIFRESAIPVAAIAELDPARSR